jgi:26S proteasome regulatory subunit N10
LGQILQALHTTSSKIGGQIDILTSIAIAQLALKHRENKNLRQRIIVFVASPLDGQAADEKSMVKLAKKLKKNNIAVDVVCYGDGIEEVTEDGKTVLKAFVENANSGDNSYDYWFSTSSPSDRSTKTHHLRTSWRTFIVRCSNIFSHPIRRSQ